MRVLIVGGNGFLGSHITDALLRVGSEVLIVDRKHELYRTPLAGVEYMIGDYSDGTFIGKALGSGVDAAIFLVSTTIPQSSNNDRVTDIEDNLVQAVHFFDRCLDYGVAKIIFPSSGGTVYGPTKATVIREDHPTEPINSYGIIKLTIEKYLAMYGSLYGLKYAALRIANPYGPRQNPSAAQGAIAVFCKKILLGEEIVVWGDGSVVRDYLYIDDVADAFVKALKADYGGIMNIGSGKGRSVRELLGDIERRLGIAAKVKYSGARASDSPYVVLDSSRARERIGWGPRVTFTEGLDRTIEWLRSVHANGGFR